MPDLVGESPLLLPVLSLVIWTLVQMCWMMVVRLPAILAADLGPDAGQRTAQLAEQLPAKVQWKADNYNHLLEQPILFYVTALVLVAGGINTSIVVTAAWAYVVLRVVHSIVQSTVNIVPARFGLFLVGSVALTVMAVAGVIELL